MLGKLIKGPYHVDSELDEYGGIGLLEVDTVFELEKTTTQVKGKMEDNLNGYLKELSNKEVTGYEIHMGMTYKREGCKTGVVVTEKLGEKVNYPVGSINEKGNVFGTYLHGIFDNIDFTRTLLNQIRENKGLEKIESKVSSFEEFKNKEYDRLADYLREHLDIEKIYEIMKD